jgi:hypothetical protein
MAIQSTAIGSTNTTLFSSTGNNAITTVMVCNKAVYDPLNPLTGLTYLNLYVVASGGSADNNLNMIVNQLPMTAGETVTFDTEKIILTNGDSIVATSASPANLIATVSYLEV